MTENQPAPQMETYQPPMLVELGEFSDDTLGTGIFTHFELTTFRYLV